VALALALGSIGGPARAQEISASAGLGHAWSDNVYISRTAAADHALVPSLRAGVDFATYWTVDYDGSAELYTEHTDLSSSAHTLRVIANPAWGDDDQNELALVAAVETLRNDDAYSSLNFVGPRLTAALTLEPLPWLAWQVAADVRYRRFYDDPVSDSLDLMPRGQVRFTLPSRTTLTPRVAYGLRYLPGLKGGQGTGRPQRTESQIDAGLHVSQGLWATGGLQADYSWRHLFSASALLPTRLTQAQFAFLTTDFLAGGHRVYVKLKQVLPYGLSLLAGGEWRTLRYSGWPAVDSAGLATADDREDRRLGPTASLAFVHRFGGTRVGATLAYQWVRQWSTSYDFDTTGQLVTVEISAGF